MTRACAPLPRSEVELSLAPFGQSRMLPRAAYVDPSVLAWEQRSFFEGGWVCAGRSSIVPSAGSQAALPICGRSVLATRDANGRLHVFENICRHRGHELLACGATAKRNTVVCPYHAWGYSLDGRLLTARATDTVANARKDDLGLIALAAIEWGGWIFVNGSGDALNFTDYVGHLTEFTANWECERLVVGATHRYQLQANWKVAIENFNECYHCPSIHKSLCAVSPPTSGGNYRHPSGLYNGGWMELAEHAETMSFSGRSSGVMLRRLTAEQRRQVHYVSLFPGLLISLHPDYVMTHRLEPISTDATNIECQWLFAPEAVATQGFDPTYAVEFWDQTNREDWAAVESVQRSLKSKHFLPGIVSDQELGVRDFVYLVASSYLGRPNLPHRLSPDSAATELASAP